MKKIMFDDKYGLTQAVLEGRKTVTRRIIKLPTEWHGVEVYGYSLVKGEYVISLLDGDDFVIEDPKTREIGQVGPAYYVGEIVALAQRYKDAHTLVPDWIESKKAPSGFVHWDEHPGYSNKEFVKAEWMPHQIRITNVRVERLQDISDEDCLREGIVKACGLYGCEGVCERGDQLFFCNPREAFAALIDKVSGKGTFDSNPWVFVYEFELVK